MNADGVRRLFQALLERFEEEKDNLGALDARIGDGDHGAAMVRGFAKAADAIRAIGQDQKDVGVLMTTSGRAFMSGTGGASGPLFATLFLELGKAAGGQESLTVAMVADGVGTAVESVRRLGRVEPGDKTMLDALLPAAEALDEAREAGTGLPEALARARDAAVRGRDSTRDMSARRGRSHYVENAGRGHVDPGATSVALIFETAHSVAEETE